MVDVLDPDRISMQLGTRALGRHVLVFESTASTHDIAAAYAAQAKHHGWVILAEQQEQGRGRGGHRWFSGRGDSVLCSVVLTECDLLPDLLSLCTAVAVAEAIGPLARVKWPNDILIQGKKVCGILNETRAFAHHQAKIVGIGINCHQTQADFPSSLRGQVTSLDTVTGTRTDRIWLIRRLLVSLETWLDRAAVDSQTVVEQWSRLSVLLGQRITVLYQGEPFTGHCLGIDPQHGLILQLEYGGVRMFEAAHSTIDKTVQPWQGQRRQVRI